jgi:hypothetical protein
MENERCLTRISPSAISDFLACEFKWYVLHYRKLVRRPLSASLFWGNATDYAVTEDYRNKINTGKNLKRANVQELFAAKIDGEHGTVEDWDTFKDKADLLDFGTKGIREFHRRISVKVDPKDVQPWLKLPFDGGVTMVGRPDVVERRPVVRDTKTSSRLWNDGRANQQIQTYAYPLMLDGDSAQPRTMVYDILVRKSEPEIQQQIVEVGPAERVAFRTFLAGLVRKMSYAISINSFPPTGYYAGNYLCSKRYCAAWKLCQATWRIDIKGEDTNAKS